MGEIDESNDEAPRAGAADDAAVGDVESAGETTAAAAITGPADTRPVGAGTLVKVAGDPQVESSPRD